MTPIYFHETLDPIREPGALDRFLHQLGEVVHTEGNAEGSVGSRCVAMWAPVFVTGQWPQLIGFWELTGGWDAFAAHFDGHQRLFHPPLERWYGERSGGFDRVLVPTGYSPDLDGMLATGRRAPVVVQQTVRLAPGTVPAYLDRLGETASTLDPDGPVSVLGAYEVAFRNRSEAVVLWAFPDVAAAARWESAPDDLPALAGWRDWSAEQEERHRGLLLRPTWWSPIR